MSKVPACIQLFDIVNPPVYDEFVPSCQKLMVGGHRYQGYQSRVLLKDLRAEAKRLGLKKYSKMKKVELENALTNV
jgi:tRNA 2-selenouridine synthase SelU